MKAVQHAGHAALASSDPLDRVDPSQTSSHPVADVASGGDLSREVYGIFGIPIDAIDQVDVFRLIDSAAERVTPFLFSTPNLNFLIKSRSDSGFRNALLLSDLCPADGMPIIWLARLLGVPLRGRVSGADIFEGLKSRADLARPIKVFLFGGAEGVAATVSSLLNARPAGMQCVGTLCPGFGSVQHMSSDEIINTINATNADFLAVFLTAAKGQAWLLLNHHRLTIPVRAHLGATINFQAGTVRRAPAFMRKLGLEWLWRIKEEPYLWRRYWNDSLQLAVLFATSALPLAAILFWSRLAGSDRAPLQVVARTESHASLTLRFAGAATAQSIKAAISEFSNALKFHRHLILDFSEVSMVDARFFGVLLMARRQIHQRDGVLEITGASPRVAKIFRLNGFEFLLNPASDF